MTRLDVTIALRSPFLFQGLDVAAGGIDASAIRDESDKPIIPGDHLRGHLRHAFLAMNRKSPVAVPDRLVEVLFGKSSADAGRDPAGDEGAYTPDGRSTLTVSDLVADATAEADGDTIPLPGRGAALYTRVAIDDACGAADDGSLQTLELVAGLDAVVRFKGTIDIAPHSAVPANIDALIGRALRLVPAMGAVKSSGFGEIVHEQCRVARSPSPTATATVIPPGDRLDLTVAFDRAIMVDAIRSAANSFASATIVPGGAIKGALAEVMKHTHSGIATPGDPFGKAFSKIRIGHAFPLADGTLADRAVPNCLVSVPVGPDTNEVVDLLEETRADAVIARAIATPAFPLDWKGKVFAAVRADLQRPESNVSPQPRGRVMINSDGVAEEGALFVTAPVPTRDDEGKPRHWRLTIDSNDADPAAFADVVAALEAGLGGVGRTGAVMKIVNGTPATLQSPHPAVYQGQAAVVLLLETPAVLTDPDDGASPAAQYQETFRALAGIDDIALLAHFARRKLAGGYAALRFRAFGPTPEGRPRYQPFELTEPGAVFVLAADAAGQVLAFAERIARTGLRAIRRTGDRTICLDWRACPFVPENGFGEVTVSPDLSGARVTVRS
ncbi:hypothetical protein A33M_1553 [Rhodovulum sp. PH10]|uniref:RAMP superfamily CRISPR-associated protein n=1 Tax=Rhodovulum sp. PH10 TaxID=1187851 RepID=UPI00027C2122|nr:RAMP superfamily CRISPR-associated protein [Rhodovulum sp. PH10]EJW09343.1 hypothetical protein A33M_1553 [Rhodovulum sp. PH10]